VVSAWCRPGQWIITNDDVAEYVRFNPNRFVGPPHCSLHLLFYDLLPRNNNEYILTFRSCHRGPV